MHKAPGRCAARPARVVPREALLTRLLNARRQRCIVLCGPPGCGKTSLLKAWRQSLLPLGFEVAWLDAVNEDAAGFLERLLASLGAVDTVLVDGLSAPGGGLADDDDIEACVLALVQRSRATATRSCWSSTTCTGWSTQAPCACCSACWTTPRRRCTWPWRRATRRACRSPGRAPPG